MPVSVTGFVETLRTLWSGELAASFSDMNNENVMENVLSFISRVQLFMNKTGTLLKSSALVAYIRLIILLEFTHECRSYLNGHGYLFCCAALFIDS